MKTDEELQKENPELYKIAREKGTDAPHSGKYVNTTDDGVYHCAVCDAALFSSDDKLNSGNNTAGLQGWPSFSDIEKSGNVETSPDDSLGMRRTEILCKQCGAHLGHVFADHKEADGKVCDHYCVNSTSLDLKKG